MYGALFPLALIICFSQCVLPPAYSHDPDSSHLVKHSTLAILKDIIITGHLEISDSAGIYHYGKQKDGCTSVYLTIINDNFWLRVFL